MNNYLKLLIASSKGNRVETSQKSAIAQATGYSNIASFNTKTSGTITIPEPVASTGISVAIAKPTPSSIKDNNNKKGEAIARFIITKGPASAHHYITVLNLKNNHSNNYSLIQNYFHLK